MTSRFMTRSYLSLLALLLWSGGASAQEIPPATPDALAAFDTVQAFAMREADFKNYSDFAAGLQAFKAKQKLAPNAELRFLLRALAPKDRIAGLTMRIVGNETSIPVPVEADGRFAMPFSKAALLEEAEIMLNRRRGDFRWRPEVRSAGLAPEQRRLGDLRLECEVRWTLEKRDVTLIQRTLFSALGGPCNNKRVNVHQMAARAVNTVRMVSGQRSMTVMPESAQPQNQIYVLPLHDSSWPDSTLIEFDYAPAQP